MLYVMQCSLYATRSHMLSPWQLVSVHVKLTRMMVNEFGNQNSVFIFIMIIIIFNLVKCDLTELSTKRSWHSPGSQWFLDVKGGTMGPIIYMQY